MNWCWHDRLTTPPDETISWANPAHEILVWDTAKDRVMLACFLADRWVDSSGLVGEEHPPVPFRWWMPTPARPPGTLSSSAWLRHAWNAEDEPWT